MTPRDGWLVPRWLCSYFGGYQQQSKAMSHQYLLKLVLHRVWVAQRGKAQEVGVKYQALGRVRDWNGPFCLVVVEAIWCFLEHQCRHLSLVSLPVEAVQCDRINYDIVRRSKIFSIFDQEVGNRTSLERSWEPT